MKKELVEIYSDASNQAVMRHPDRSFPGSLIQGDSLYSLVQDVEEAKTELEAGKQEDALEIIVEIIERLNDRLDHYKKVLNEHGHKLPFAN